LKALAFTDFAAKVAIETLQFPSYETVTRKPTGIATGSGEPERGEQVPWMVVKVVVATVAVVVEKAVDVETSVVIRWLVSPTR